jgi:alpha-beta hydrolase superfamily lysophospholipase
LWYYKIFTPYKASSPKSQPSGLIVLIHGLRGSREIWHTQLNLLKSYNYDIYVPIVPHQGLCSLQEASTPILDYIINYINIHPRIPICILGVSNGGRIALYLDLQLRSKFPKTPVFISNIASPHNGSSRMNLLIKLHLANFFYPQILQEELLPNSETNMKLMLNIQSPTKAPRQYEFYGTTTDLHIPELESTLPQIPNHNTTHYVLYGHSHNSIVHAAAENQIRNCVQWISKYNRKD